MSGAFYGQFDAADFLSSVSGGTLTLAMLMGDPIVEELHKIREDMLAEHGGLEGLVKHLRALQAKEPERVITLPPKPPVATK